MLRGEPFAPLPQKKRRAAYRARGLPISEARPGCRAGQYTPVHNAVDNLGTLRDVVVDIRGL